MTSLDGRRLRSGALGPDRAPSIEDATDIEGPDARPGPDAGPGDDDEAVPADDLQAAPDDHPAAPDAAPVAAPDAAPDADDPSGSTGGTLWRSRPARGARSEPTGVPPVADEVLALPEPARRPVPPTFPSPGQPPPGVARRAGRHARPEVDDGRNHTPPEGYRPRHAAPDAETERFPAVGSATGPGGAGPVPLAPPPPARVLPPPPDAPPTELGPVTSPTPTGSDRVRVVFAERRAPTRAVRTVAEIEQQTETGELLLGNLLRAQLTLGLRLGAVAVLLLGALPMVFLAFPGLAAISVAGVRLPWLLLGVAPYPLMLLLAWLYTRTAERNELDFADNVED